MLLQQQLRSLFFSVFFLGSFSWSPSLSCLSARTMLARPGIATNQKLASSASRPRGGMKLSGISALKCSESDTETHDAFQTLSDNAADVMSLPMHPDPNLKPEDVILGLVRGLQFNDVPEPDSGLRRCFEFSCDMCKAAVGGVESRAGGASVETFIKYAKNPTFSSMCGCTGFKRGPINVIPGTEMRGALATQVVTILRDGSKDRNFLWTLQQERRPPLQGCWLVRECLFMENAIALTL